MSLAPHTFTLNPGYNLHVQLQPMTEAQGAAFVELPLCAHFCCAQCCCLYMPFKTSWSSGKHSLMSVHMCMHYPYIPRNPETCRPCSADGMPAKASQESSIEAACMRHTIPTYLTKHHSAKEPCAIAQGAPTHMPRDSYTAGCPSHPYPRLTSLTLRPVMCPSHRPLPWQSSCWGRCRPCPCLGACQCPCTPTKQRA